MALNDLKGKALQLVSLINYQENSVVSKQLLDKKNGTLTLFAFDAGQGLSEHTAPYDATILAIDGKAEVLIGGEPHEVSASQMIIMPAHIPHAVKVRERFKMLLIMIRSEE
jgi:quercetin dioxygenase-like cupin family protein